jgi:TRAP-type C4-dicarboxylate transport system permease small subunit
MKLDQIGKALKAVQTTLVKVSGFACGISIWTMALLIFAGAIERNFFGTNLLLNADEVLGYLMVILFSLGLVVTLVYGGHVQIDIFYRHFPKTFKRFCHPLFQGVGICCGLAIAAGGLSLAVDSYLRGRISSSSLEIPLYIPQSLIILGGLAFAAEFLNRIFQDRDED